MAPSPAQRSIVTCVWILVAVVVADRAIAYLTGVEPWLIFIGGDGLAVPVVLWAFGHCDTVDGPVVTRARQALESGKVNLVLPWVRPEDEPEIRLAFDHARAVRALGAEARDLADRHFFETLVRIHRAGEGAGFTGLKPAGSGADPAIAAADQAVESESAESILRLLTDEIGHGLHARHHAVVHQKHFDPDDVRAGRRYVQAYVDYIHYVESLWRVATGAAHGAHGSSAGAMHEHSA